MTIDLHAHSNQSDGTDSPHQLVVNAKAAGLEVVALTDHDYAGGWDEAQAAADALHIQLVRGMEISTDGRGKGIHLLAYNFDPTHAPLVAELDRVLESRARRVPLILAKLAELGMPLTEADVARWQGDAAAAGRPHIADAMVEKGYVADRGEAFDKWLGDGCPARVAKRNVPILDAIRLVTEAGGKSVVAHAWGRGSASVMTPEYFAELADAGMAGIEVDHNDHSPQQRRQLRQIAADLDLIVTGSSDYHGVGKSAEFSLGCNTTARDQLERLLD